MEQITLVTAEDLEQHAADYEVVAVYSVMQKEDVKEGNEEFRHILLEYTDIFSEDLPPERHVDHAIHLEPGTTPLHQAPYRLSPPQQDEVEDRSRGWSSEEFRENAFSNIWYTSLICSSVISLDFGSCCIATRYELDSEG